MDNRERQAHEIQVRMAALRDDLGAAVDETAAHARRWSDWRHYVKRFPLVTTALVAAVGYTIVPRRPRIISPDADTLAELARREQLVISRPSKASHSESAARKVLGIVAIGAARAAMNYMSDKLAATANGQTHPRATPSSGATPTSSRRRSTLP